MNFDSIAQDISRRLASTPPEPVSRWQSVQAPQPMRELLNYSFTYSLPTEDIQFYRDQLKPNLPWADDHFEKERVGGDPLNPGQEWRNWPYAQSANKHRREGEEDPQFDHSYAERIWCKAAGMTKGGILESDKLPGHRRGIRFNYGDLDDLVTCLSAEPTTRQAYLPIWFPEDLGAMLQQKRVPCTLGYHFIMRSDKLHVVYYLRSCDFVRHMRDDSYMAIRLLLHVLDQCRLAAPEKDWDKVSPGTLTQHMTSLHCFEKDPL